MGEHRVKREEKQGFTTEDTETKERGNGELGGEREPSTLGASKQECATVGRADG
jgi:hypothetical protein